VVSLAAANQPAGSLIHSTSRSFFTHLNTHTQALIDAHRAYYDAGANIAITASYQASSEGLMKSFGLSSAAADALIVRSVELANIAREQWRASHPDTAASTPLFVAASMGPYGATLHNGSEYTGAYSDADIAALRAFHEHRINLLDACGADVLAFETIPSLEEAKVLTELLRGAHTPAWVSFCCRDELHLSVRDLDI
jgi:homocysteine S-methyltransferase